MENSSRDSTGPSLKKERSSQGWKDAKQKKNKDKLEGLFLLPFANEQQISDPIMKNCYSFKCKW